MKKYLIFLFVLFLLPFIDVHASGMKIAGATIGQQFSISNYSTREYQSYVLARSDNVRPWALVQMCSTAGTGINSWNGNVGQGWVSGENLVFGTGSSCGLDGYTGEIIYLVIGLSEWSDAGNNNAGITFTTAIKNVAGYNAIFKITGVMITDDPGSSITNFHQNKEMIEQNYSTNNKIDETNSLLRDNASKINQTNSQLRDVNSKQAQTNQKLDENKQQLIESNKKQDETNKKLDETNQAIKDANSTMQDSDTSGANNTANSFFDDFESDDYGLSDIITMPLELINNLTSNSCVELELTVPFVDKKMKLPCMSTIYSTHFNSAYVLYQTITTGFIAYWVVVKIYALVKSFKDPEDDRIEVMDL